jgi:TonB family protein
MKIIIVLFFACLFFTACSSKVSSSGTRLSTEDSLIVFDEFKRSHSESDTFLRVDKFPEPIGGIEGISKKLYYTKRAQENKIEGKVLLLCLVKKDGSVDNIRVLKSLGYGLDEIAGNAVKTTKFKPGEANGKPVDVETIIPLMFKLR